MLKVILKDISLKAWAIWSQFQVQTPNCLILEELFCFLINSVQCYEDLIHVYTQKELTEC